MPTMSHDAKHRENELKGERASEGVSTQKRTAKSATDATPSSKTSPIIALLLDDSDQWGSAQKDLLVVAEALCANAGLYDVQILCRIDSPLHKHLSQAAEAHTPFTCVPFFSQPALSGVALWRLVVRLLWRFNKKARMCVHTFSPSCLPLARSLWRWRHRDKKNASNKSTLVFHTAYGTPQAEHLCPRDVARLSQAVEKILCPSHYALHAWAEAGAQPECLSVINPICHVPPQDIAHSGNIKHPHTAPTAAQRFIFMAFEKLEDDAGLGVLLKAMAALWQHPDLPEWEVRVVGTGSQFDALLQEAQALGVAPRLGLFGEQPVDYMAPTAHTIVCPYISAAGNINTLTIAWSYGLPLICTQVTAHIELATTHNALLMPPNDPQSLAAAMISCMRDADIWTRAAHLSTTMTVHARAPRLQEQYMTIYNNSVARHGWPMPHAQNQSQSQDKNHSATNTANSVHAHTSNAEDSAGANHEV